MDSQLISLLLALSIFGVVWKSTPVFSAWWRSRRGGAPLGLLTVWVIFFRNLPLDAVVDAHLSARAAGVPIALGEIVAHARAGGDIRTAVHAYVETRRAGTEVDFCHVCELELEEQQTVAGPD